MGDVMVTGRMSASKKRRGNAVLQAAGLSASEAINILYERLIAEQGVRFLIDSDAEPSEAQWRAALDFVDELVEPRSTRFDEMSSQEIRRERLASRGLLDDK